ncbi:hypothetical protein Dimus_012437 [Dionaea muscipula]
MNVSIDEMNVGFVCRVFQNGPCLIKPETWGLGDTVPNALACQAGQVDTLGRDGNACYISNEEKHRSAAGETEDEESFKCIDAYVTRKRKSDTSVPELGNASL